MMVKKVYVPRNLMGLFNHKQLFGWSEDIQCRYEPAEVKSRKKRLRKKREAAARIRMEEMLAAHSPQPVELGVSLL